ncbi:hypothetical protein ENSA5_36460 [Enhygromyxa salina]|uniref:Uncharacterized protein n=2 Tax=Enhygromyxa salina TaxID=215803 RepID=A0A2S9XV05_9BACT|nr:hypothetical protein ENSA5_36460 [Enhygromyxa salina]
MFHVLKPALNSNSCVPTLHFEWDEWRVHRYYVPFEGEAFARLGQLTGRANAALAYASGEWILHRFAAVNHDETPRLYLEACWAANVHWAYFPYVEIDEDRWRGPVRGPLLIMMAIAGDAYFGLDDDAAIQARSLWMRNLALHVLPDSGAYLAWFDASLARLEHHHRKDQHPETEDMLSPLPEGMGAPPPRELFDTSQPYEPSHDAERLDAYLRGLDPDASPFLAGADALAGLDAFVGTPYRYR